MPQVQYLLNAIPFKMPLMEKEADGGRVQLLSKGITIIGSLLLSILDRFVKCLAFQVNFELFFEIFDAITQTNL